MSSTLITHQPISVLEEMLAPGEKMEAVFITAGGSTEVTFASLPVDGEGKIWIANQPNAFFGEYEVLDGVSLPDDVTYRVCHNFVLPGDPPKWSVMGVDHIFDHTDLWTIGVEPEDKKFAVLPVFDPDYQDRKWHPTRVADNRIIRPGEEFDIFLSPLREGPATRARALEVNDGVVEIGVGVDGNGDPEKIVSYTMQALVRQINRVELHKRVNALINLNEFLEVTSGATLDVRRRGKDGGIRYDQFRIGNVLTIDGLDFEIKAIIPCANRHSPDGTTWYLGITKKYLDPNENSHRKVTIEYYMSVEEYLVHHDHSYRTLPGVLFAKGAIIPLVMDGKEVPHTIQKILPFVDLMQRDRGNIYSECCGICVTDPEGKESIISMYDALLLQPE